MHEKRIRVPPSLLVVYLMLLNDDFVATNTRLTAELEYIDC